MSPERSVTYVSGTDTLKLVEAAGVEPASEKVYRMKATCVSGSLVFDRLIRYRQEETA